MDSTESTHGGMAERTKAAVLKNRYMGNCIVGSNPTPSAIYGPPSNGRPPGCAAHGE